MNEARRNICNNSEQQSRLPPAGTSTVVDMRGDVWQKGGCPSMCLKSSLRRFSGSSVYAQAARTLSDTHLQFQRVPESLSSDVLSCGMQQASDRDDLTCNLQFNKGAAGKQKNEAHL